MRFEPRVSRWLSAGGDKIVQGSALLVPFLFLLSAQYFQRRYYPGWFLLSPDPLGWRHPGVFAVAGSLLILACAISRSSWIARCMSAALLRSIGIVSFSVYLLHPYVIEAVMRAGREATCSSSLRSPSRICARSSRTRSANAPS